MRSPAKYKCYNEPARLGASGAMIPEGVCGKLGSARWGRSPPYSIHAGTQAGNFRCGGNRDRRPRRGGVVAGGRAGGAWHGRGERGTGRVQGRSQARGDPLLRLAQAQRAALRRGGGGGLRRLSAAGERTLRRATGSDRGRRGGLRIPAQARDAAGADLRLWPGRRWNWWCGGWAGRSGSPP